MNYPFNDDYMQYDINSHKYRLLPKACLELLGINLSDAGILNPTGDANSATLPDRFLAQVSNTLYNWIYSHTIDKLWVEYILAKYPPCREIIQQALLNEVIYTLRNGQIGFESGVNLIKNSVINKAELRQSLVSYDTEMLLSQALPNGIRLTHQGRYIHPILAYREDY